SAWYAHQGMTSEAIGHALAAGATERAADLIEAAAPNAIARGEQGTVARWLVRLPDELARARPRLALATAWGLGLDGRVGGIEGWLQRVEAAPDAAAFAGEVAALRGLSLILRDAPRSITLSQQALAQLQEDQQFVRGAAALNLGTAHWLIG